jgi:hypothetical protein
VSFIIGEMRSLEVASNIRGAPLVISQNASGGGLLWTVTGIPFDPSIGSIRDEGRRSLL